ncbi:MAG: hypothetical protein OEV44_15055 [Spirochaetota bacterium]|nr:hypothetical protein [Spirochaetota bacterium]
MKRFIIFFGLFSFYTSFGSLYSNEYFADRPIEEYTNKKYYAFAYNMHIKKYPEFTKQINPKFLHFFNKYYVVYTRDSEMIAFEVYENKSLFSRNTIRKGYVKFERFDSVGRTLIYQQLFYNYNQDILIEKNYKNGRLFTYYVYHYFKSGFLDKVEIFNKKHQLITRITYNYDEYNRLKSISRNDRNLESYHSGSVGPRINLTNVKTIKTDIGTTKIIVKVFNPTNKAFDNLSISVDLYNERNEMVDTLLGKPKSDNYRIDSSATGIIETSETNKLFSRMRLYIHYTLLDDTRLFYTGPFFLTRYSSR